MSDKIVSSSSSSSGGIGFFGLLTVALVVLKVLGHIDISWIWVFAPIWIPLSIGLILWISFVVFVILMDRK